MTHLRRSFPCRQAAAAALLFAAACTGSSGNSSPVISLVEDAAHPGASYVEVTGIDADTRRTAGKLTPSSPEWTALLRVSVLDADGRGDTTAVAGKYAVAGRSLRFTPLFAFDPGRRYEVRFAPAGTSRDPHAGIREIVALRAAPPSPPTQVTQIFPSAEVVPENQLRLYIHFSAPMGRRGGLGHIKLLDDRGHEVVDPFLPLDAEFWNADHTRYTLFFDPGRQKRGILPNREMGPSLLDGRRYTLVVDREWIEGQGRPLGGSFTRSFRVGPPDQRPIDYTAWRIAPPVSGTRDPLVVDFPEPLDQGLLLRAVGVRRDGQPVVGDVRVERHETRWTLTPSEPWRTGRHELIALSILEDLAGNRIGRAFEVDGFDRIDEAAEPAPTSIPFEPVQRSARR